MKDRFFTQENCDRCGKSLSSGRIMSMLNKDCICMECHRKEKDHPRYKEAQDAEMAEVKKGNYNYTGVWQLRNGGEKT